MSQILQLRKQTLTHFDANGEPWYTEPEVLALGLYPELKRKKAELELRASKEGIPEKHIIFWITAPPPSKIKPKGKTK